MLAGTDVNWLVRADLLPLRGRAQMRDPKGGWTEPRRP